MTACVLLFAAAPAGSPAAHGGPEATPAGPDAVADAYHRISRSLAGTPGLLRNALLELVDAPGRFVVLSEWASLQAFRAWEEGTDHRRLTAPLRPYHDRSMSGGYGVYRVAAEYRS